MSGSPEKKMSEDAQNAKVSTGTRRGLTQERLKELLEYDQYTGFFTRKTSTGGQKRGTKAGYFRPDRYMVIEINGIKYRASRLAFLWMLGYFPEHEAEHKDRNPSNNKWANLREATRSCNIRNCGKLRNNKSGVTGVCWNEERKKWVAQVVVLKKTISLGRFYSFLDAVNARWEAEVKYGWPNCNSASSAYQYLKTVGAIK